MSVSASGLLGHLLSSPYEQMEVWGGDGTRMLSAAAHRAHPEHSKHPDSKNAECGWSYHAPWKTFCFEGLHTEMFRGERIMV